MILLEVRIAQTLWWYLYIRFDYFCLFKWISTTRFSVYNDILSVLHNAIIGIIAGCRNSLPSKFSSNKWCKKLNTKCSKLKKKCSSKLSGAIGTSSNALKCRSALSTSQKNTKIKNYCRISCNKCGKFMISKNMSLGLT